MHVGIDITSLIYGRGVSRYTANLAGALMDRPDVKLSLYGSSFRQQSQLKSMAGTLIKAHSASGQKHQALIQPYPPMIQNVLWNWLNLNPVSKVLPGLDVFHSWDWIQPPDKNIPLVSTIHDLAILKYPESAHSTVVSMHRQAWKRLAENHAHLIAVTHATKKDIIDYLEYPPYLIHVVHEALPIEVKQISERLDEETYSQTRLRLDLTKPYILFVGTREPRKNLIRLIEAWAPLQDKVQLIIAGEKGWDETAELSPSTYKDQLRFLGRVSDVELTVLYGEAEALAFPSLYEGFGLPILEAFYHGTPVITSNAPALIEVAGNAAEFVDPLEVESIREGIETILNESIVEQQKRLQRMIIRLQMFDWRFVAQETLAVYQQAINQKKS
jgi:glycosyltransferase involved in cell wall biosynthesis